jgi:hypothetical protein
MKKKICALFILTFLFLPSAFADFNSYAGMEFEFGTLSVLGINAEIGYSSEFDFVNFSIYADLSGGLGLYKNKGLRIAKALAFDWRAGALADLYIGPENLNVGIGLGGGLGLKGDPYLRITLPLRVLSNVFKLSINYDTFFSRGWRLGTSLLVDIGELL